MIEIVVVNTGVCEMLAAVCCVTEMVHTAAVHAMYMCRSMV